MPQMLKCPHCGTLVENGVSVCRGCQAEIVDGPTGKEAGGCGCATVVIFFVVLWFLGNKTGLFDVNMFPTWLNWTIIIVGFLAGVVISLMAFSEKRFIRGYKHDR